VEECRRRLARAGKDLEERYHTVADLTFYRARFLEVARELPRASVVDAQGEPEQVLARALAALRSAGVVPSA
jgi:thymidylate kinase